MSAQDLERLLATDVPADQSSRPSAIATGGPDDPFSLTTAMLQQEQQGQQQQPVSASLGPQPPQTLPSQNPSMTGVYSSSGFDMIGILSRLVNRLAKRVHAILWKKGS